MLQTPFPARSVNFHALLKVLESPHCREYAEYKGSNLGSTHWKETIIPARKPVSNALN